jgi:hypothetical protein
LVRAADERVVGCAGAPVLVEHELLAAVLPVRR